MAKTNKTISKIHARETRGMSGGHVWITEHRPEWAGYPPRMVVLVTLPDVAAAERVAHAVKKALRKALKREGAL